MSSASHPAAVPVSGPPGESRPWSTILALRSDPLGFLERIAARYGDLAHLRVGPYPLIFVNHPDLIHEVLVTKDASFIKGRVLDQARDVFGQGLLTSEGDCIGMGFAWMEGVLLLATIGRGWKMRLVSGHRVEPYPRITLRPKDGVRVTMARRG